MFAIVFQWPYHNRFRFEETAEPFIYLQQLEGCAAAVLLQSGLFDKGIAGLPLQPSLRPAHANNAAMQHQPVAMDQEGERE